MGVLFVCFNCDYPCLLFTADADNEPNNCPWGMTAKWRMYKEVEA